MQFLINRNIKEFREFLGLNQKEFAEVLGVSEGLISYIERGRREPTAKFIQNLCETFHVKPERILRNKHKIETIEPGAPESNEKTAQIDQ